MALNFQEWLIVVMIGLLFARDYLPAIFSKWLGVKVNGKETDQDEFRGWVKAKLEDICEKMDAFGARLSKHLDDEEKDVREVRDSIRDIYSKL